MYSLHLTCLAAEAEEVSAALWDAGTAGIREDDQGDVVRLIAGFEDDIPRHPLSTRFKAHNPAWVHEEDVDWVLAVQQAWPGRSIGERLFLAPPWNLDVTPEHRIRIIHNPGLASGTGEHPCTQLALASLEICVTPGCVVVDVGAGSGILSVACLRLGGDVAVGLDLDLSSLPTAAENFSLNDLTTTLAAGSADCIAGESADIVVANISATVLLSIADELVRILRPGGWFVLTGFTENELSGVEGTFGEGQITATNEWRCLTVRYS